MRLQHKLTNELTFFVLLDCVTDYYTLGPLGSGQPAVIDRWETVRVSDPCGGNLGCHSGVPEATT